MERDDTKCCWTTCPSTWRVVVLVGGAAAFLASLASHFGYL